MLTIDIYTSKDCHYCEKAKSLLAEHGLEYTEWNIAEQESYRQALIQRAPGARTLPQIFENNNHIGSYEDLVVWLKNQT